MAPIDQDICKRLKTARGFRYIDDYELLFSSRSDAEDALNELQQALETCELALNSTKTRIVELPYPHTHTWASELSSYRIRSGTAQATDLINLFSRAFDVHRTRPDEPVLNFALARLRSLTVARDNWPLLQQLLLQCAAAEFETLRYVLEHFIDYRTRKMPVNRAMLGDVLAQHIVRHGGLGHGTEVAWALWGAMVFKIKLDASVANSISKMDDSFVALLALDARTRGLLPSSLPTTNWEQYMTQEELYGEQWLLSYEAGVKGWLPSLGGADHVAGDRCFGEFKRLGIEFYDTQKVSLAPLPRLRQRTGGYVSPP